MTGGWPDTTVSYMMELEGVAVLVVDDDADNLAIVEYLIGKRGGATRCAGSAQDALEMLLHWTPDLLLLDISMPEMDGLDLLQTIRGIERLRVVPAIAVTAHAYASDRQRCLEAGFADHISKPYDPDALMLRIVEMVGRPASQPLEG